MYQSGRKPKVVCVQSIYRKTAEILRKHYKRKGHTTQNEPIHTVGRRVRSDKGRPTVRPFFDTRHTKYQNRNFVAVLRVQREQTTREDSIGTVRSTATHTKSSVAICTIWQYFNPYILWVIWATFHLLLIRSKPAYLKIWRFHYKKFISH